MKGIVSDYHAYLVDNQADIIKKFGIQKEIGLTISEVEIRKKVYGSNQLGHDFLTWWHILLRQFSSPFVYLFIAIACLFFIANEISNGILVFFFVGINSFIGFYQEYRANKSFELIREHLQANSVVLRDGKQKYILNTDTVPGDLVILAPGEKIPADMRFIECVGCEVDESVLTGESAPVVKTADPIVNTKVDVFDAANIGFAGTRLVSGKALGVVFAIGKKTYMGSLAESIHTNQQGMRESTLVAGSKQLGTFLMRFVLVSMGLIFLANLVIKGKFSAPFEFLVFTMTLVLSVIPEALPLVVTFCLTRGISQLLKDQVIVKRLSAIEDFGSMQVLCTDKTGTITQNNMQVVDTYTKKDGPVVAYAALATAQLKEKPDERALQGFDAALWYSLSAQDKAYIHNFKQHAEIPFDHKRLRNLMLVGQNNDYFLVARGMPESVLSLCSDISSAEREKIMAWMSQQGANGHRVIAVALKQVANEVIDLIKGEEEKQFVFMGLISFLDPIKDTAQQAINRARNLNVIIKILSGDSKEVCASLAWHAQLIQNDSQVTTGSEFMTKSLEEKRLIVEHVNVFSRVTPEQKYEIIQLLQERYRVGYMGDGINDVSALRIADVSLAVSNATAIARDMADIILMSDDLNVLVDAIQEGRKIVVNTLKYIKTTISLNFGNFYSIAIISLLINYLPMLPIHILFLNILSDFPMIAIATDTVDEQELDQPRKFSIRDTLFFITILGLVGSIFDFIFFAIFHRFNPSEVHTGWFVLSVLTEVFFIFSMRTRRFAFKGSLPSIALITFSLLSALIALIIPQTYLGSVIFEFVPLMLWKLALIIFLSISYFFTTELIKHIYYRYFGNNNASIVRIN